ncbi:MAG: DUF2179 domain-containing protein [Planctomycetota bacterium]
MLDVALTCLLIIAARITDVSLGTIRTINIVQGRRTLAVVLGFFEVLIWVMVVSRVIKDIQQPAYALAYAVGFALGNFIGMSIEGRLAMGRQVIRIFTRRAAELAPELRESGHRVTQFDGMGRDGPVQQLFIEIVRRDARKLIQQARTLDPRCYYMVDDVRYASSAEMQLGEPTGWRALLKKK